MHKLELQVRFDKDDCRNHGDEQQQMCQQLFAHRLTRKTTELDNTTSCQQASCQTPTQQQAAETAL